LGFAKVNAKDERTKIAMKMDEYLELVLTLSIS